jgi:3,4-dihydroxy 2-butanone 4-phosphate synthase/GTP cyclohydrolase II
MRFDSIESAVADIRRGRAVVVVDDESRENEGDVVFAASKSTPTKINFLARHARGLICVALSADRVEQLGLPQMTDRNRGRHETAFTVSVEAREGVTTGISAADRSLTARKLADGSLGPDAFVSPGHTFPLKARRGGVLVRAGHTEAAVDLVQMAGLGCAGVICEILKSDGTMARLPDSTRFARRHGLKIISVAALIHHRHLREKLVRQAGVFRLPTPHGEFDVHAFEDLVHGRLHLALVRGEIDPARAIPVRVHSEALLEDVFRSAREGGENALDRGLSVIARDGGVFLYMRRIRSEEDLIGAFQRYAAQDAQGSSTRSRAEKKSRETKSRETGNASMDARTRGIGAQILFELGARKLHLLTNHPRRIQGLEGYGLRIVRQSPLPGADRSPRKSGKKEST